jgi:hypothetical protein
MKSIVLLVFFLAIAGSLGAALYFMRKGNEEGEPASKKMARALAVRVGLSILLFICLLLAWKWGYIQPTGIRPGQ